MTRVAVLGGGQLGWMLGLAGIPLGFSFAFLDPVAGAPGAAVGELVVGGLDDIEAARRVAVGAAVVTYEWEGVPAATARALESLVPVYPPARALDVSQDRVVEKQTLRSLGIATAAFQAVDSIADLRTAVDAIGLPAVLKTRRGGYDGKGQVVLGEPAELDTAWTRLGNSYRPSQLTDALERDRTLYEVRAIIRPMADLALHLAAMRAWPFPTEAPRYTAVPGPAADRWIKANAKFRTDVLKVLANEIAPRVHNSGHWTIEGAETSQFENHVRAILGLPLGSTVARGVSAMVNCIGTMPDRDAVLRTPGAHLHDYGKTARPGRKVGHVTVTASDAERLEPGLTRVRELCDCAGLS